jgi:uncharacterized membrane protein YhaH (DUF805 family)
LVCITLAATYGLPYLLHLDLPWVVTVWLWAFAYITRLHDIGRSGWWTVAPMVASIIPLGIGATMLGPNFLKAASGNHTGLGDESIITWAVAVTASAVVQQAFTLWLGLQRGDDGPNRFGSRWRTAPIAESAG